MCITWGPNSVIPLRSLWFIVQRSTQNCGREALPPERLLHASRPAEQALDSNPDAAEATLQLNGSTVVAMSIFEMNKQQTR